MVPNHPPSATTLPVDPELAPTAARDFLTIDEVADRLGVNERTVRRWIRAGQLPCLSIGRTRRIPVSALSSSLSGYAAPKADETNQNNALTSPSEDTSA